MYFLTKLPIFHDFPNTTELICRNALTVCAKMRKQPPLKHQHSYTSTVQSNSSRSSHLWVISWRIKFANKYCCSIKKFKKIQTSAHVDVFHSDKHEKAINWSLLMSGLILLHAVLVSVVHPTGGHAHFLLHLQN